MSGSSAVTAPVKPEEGLVVKKLAEVAVEYGVEPEDVLDFAEYLGMHPYEDAGDLEFLWLAAEGIFAPLPAGWAEYKMPDGQPYFYNIETRRSQWEHPMDAWYRKLYLKSAPPKRYARISPRARISHRPIGALPVVPMNVHLILTLLGRQKQEGADQTKLRAHFKKNKGSPEKLQSQKHLPSNKSRSLKRRLTSMLKGRKSKKNVTGDDTQSMGSLGEHDDTASVNSQQRLPEEILYQRSMFPEHDESNQRRTSFDASSASTKSAAKSSKSGATGDGSFASTIESLKAQATTNDEKLKRLLEDTKAEKDKAVLQQVELSKKVEEKAAEASSLARAKEESAAEISSLKRQVELLSKEKTDSQQQIAQLKSQLSETESAVRSATDGAGKVQAIQLQTLKDEKKLLEDKLRMEREQSAAELQQLRVALEQERAQAAERHALSETTAEKRTRELSDTLDRERRDAHKRDAELSEKLRQAQAALTTEQQRAAKATKECEAFKQSQGAVAAKLTALRSGIHRTVVPALRELKTKQAQLRTIVHECQRSQEGEMSSMQQSTVKQLDAIVKRSLASMETELTRKEQRIAQMNVKVRKLHNEIQDLKGNIRVLCRVRPLSKEEEAQRLRYAVSFPEDDVVSLSMAGREDTQGMGKVEERQFQYNRVFPPAFDQKQVFAEAEQLVTSVMDGYNVCMFAYGQTGSGKTFTMEGPSANRGVYYRAVAEMFRLSEERAGKWSYDVQISLVEIYNEKLIDLLNDKRSKKIDDDEEDIADSKLEVYHEADGAVEIKGLTQVMVCSVADVEREIEHGTRNRSTFATKINEHSSRSHLIVSFRIRGTDARGITSYHSKLHLIDLAGA
jgi:kinesin family protein C2/C3